MPRLVFSGGTLVLEGLAFADRPSFTAPGEWIWDSRVRAWRCDAISYSELRADPAFIAAQIVDAVPDWRRVLWPKSNLRKLRADQKRAASRESVPHNRPTTAK